MGKFELFNIKNGLAQQSKRDIENALNYISSYIYCNNFPVWNIDYKKYDLLFNTKNINYYEYDDQWIW